MALKDFRTADSGGIKYIWRQVVNELFNLSSQLMAWATGKFVQTINGKSGTSITIAKSDVGLANVDNTADKDKSVAHAETAGDADTLDGKQADDFMLKSDHDGYEDVISTSLNDLEARKVDKESGKGLSSNDFTTDEKQKLAGIEAGAQKHIAPTADEVKNALGYTPANTTDLVDYTVTVTENGASGNTIKSYVLKQKESTIGTINIPKDLVVSSGSVVVGNWVNGVFTESASGTGKAVKLVIANQEDPIYINVQDLVDVYTAAQGATEIQLAISNTNEISATLVKEVRDKIDNAIPKVSGAAGKVAQFNEDGSLESSSYEIKTSVPENAVFTDSHTTKEGHYVPSEDAGSQLSKSASGGTDAWDFNVVTGVTIKRDVKGHVVGVDVASKKVPANPNTDYQTTKGGHYTPTANEKTLSPDTSILRDPARDMAFVGAVHEDEKGHVVSVETVAILALTNAEIQAIIDQVTAEMAAEMA